MNDIIDLFRYASVSDVVCQICDNKWPIVLHWSLVQSLYFFHKNQKHLN